MTYQDILKSVGYPTDILTLDFETYYDNEYSLGKMSTIEYIMDDRFELLGLGAKYNDKPSVFNPGPQSNLWVPNDIDNYTIIVHHARFDITVLQTKFGIIPKYIIDVEDLARHYDARMSHKIKDLAPMFGLKPKGDTSQFKGLHWDTMTEEQRKACMEYTLGDVEIETDLLKILLPRLTNPEFELQLMRHTLDLWLHKTFAFDFALADVLKTRMRIKVGQILEKLDIPSYSNRVNTLEKYHPERKRDRLEGLVSGNKSFVELLKNALPENESIPMKKGKKGNIPALAQADDGCKWLLAHTNPNVKHLMQARQAVKSWPLHMARIDNMERQANANGGNLRTPLNYYAGHTGRWGGAEGINEHNLGGRGRTGAGIDPLIGQMRELLCALAGCVLGIGDSAQIEARILAWLAGQNDLLQEFAEGKSPYCTLAATLFGKKVWKPTDEEKKTPEGKIMAVQYGFGKDSILGCGYGMGADKFYQRCLQNPSLRPLFDSGQYDRKFIERLIKTYRTTYKHIPEYWTHVERVFKQCIKFSHLKPTVGPLEFSCHGSEVHLKLPSGRVLYYRHCRVDKKGTIKYHWGSLWGGSITENIVQSVARDLLGYWILECERFNLPVTLHVHDEIVCMIKKSTNDMYQKLQLKRLNDIFCSLPDWAEGLPVGAKVKESEVYCK